MPFGDAHQIKLVFLSFGRPPRLITPSPNFPLHDVLQVGNRNRLSEDLAWLCAGNEFLVTLVLGELDIELAGSFSGIQRVLKLLDAEASRSKLVGDRTEMFRD